MSSLSKPVARLVDDYVATSARSHHLISTADAVRAIKHSASGCEHTDRELAELVIASAIRAGCDLEFDANFQ